MGKKHRNIRIDGVKSTKEERTEAKPRVGKNDPIVVPDMSCRLCKGPIVKVPWNSVIGIMYCNTSTCPLHRTPIKPEKSFAERMGKDSSRIKERIEKLKMIFTERNSEE